MRKVASQAETNPPHLGYTAHTGPLPRIPYARAADFQSAFGRFLFFVTKPVKWAVATLNRSSGLTLVCSPQVHGTSTNNPCALWGFSDEFTGFEGGEATSPIHRHFQEAQMARNNHQESETARAGVREATDRAEDVVQTGIEAARRVAEEFGRVLGVGGQNENLTRQASQNFEAITETGSVLIRGFQDVSREWLDLMQERLRKNAEGITKLAQCRTLPDLAAVQSDLARDNLNQIIDVTRRIAERSMKVADEAAKTITAETGKSAGRFPRAA